MGGGLSPAGVWRTRGNEEEERGREIIRINIVKTGQNRQKYVGQLSIIFISHNKQLELEVHSSEAELQLATLTWQA